MEKSSSDWRRGSLNALRGFEFFFFNFGVPIVMDLDPCKLSIYVP